MQTLTLCCAFVCLFRPYLLLTGCTHTRPFNGPLFGTAWLGHYQKKHYTSFINFLHVLLSIASSLFVLDSTFPQPFQVLFWSSSWSGTLCFLLHTILYPIIIFFSQLMHMPWQPVLLSYQCYVIYSYSVSQLLAWKSVFHLNATHIHLTILISALRSLCCMRRRSAANVGSVMLRPLEEAEVTDDLF